DARDEGRLLPSLLNRRSIVVGNHRWIRGLSVALIAAGMAACQGTDEPVGGAGDRSGADIQTYLDALPGARVVDADAAGVPSFVVGWLGTVDVKDDPRAVD